MSARDTSGSAPQHTHPHNNTMSRNKKFWVDQVTPPPPRGGTTRGGGVHVCVYGGHWQDCVCFKWTTPPSPEFIKQQSELNLASRVLINWTILRFVTLHVLEVRENLFLVGPFLEVAQHSNFFTSRYHGLWVVLLDHVSLTKGKASTQATIRAIGTIGVLLNASWAHLFCLQV